MERWAIKNKQGEILAWTIRYGGGGRRTKAAFVAMVGLKWPALAEAGYSCIRVDILEKKDDEVRILVTGEDIRLAAREGISNVVLTDEQVGECIEYLRGKWGIMCMDISTVLEQILCE